MRRIVLITAGVVAGVALACGSVTPPPAVIPTDTPTVATTPAVKPTA